MPSRGPGPAAAAVSKTPPIWGLVHVRELPASFPEPDWGHVARAHAALKRLEAESLLEGRPIPVPQWIRDAFREEQDYHRRRGDIEPVVKSNTITEYGKDYFVRFAGKANSRLDAQPFFATATAEADDYLTKIAVGDGATGPPDPTAFTEKNDTIQSFRCRGKVVSSLDVDPAEYPHAVRFEGRFDGPDVRPSIADMPFDMDEMALVAHNSQDSTGSYPGNMVVAYCTNTDSPYSVGALARISIEWIIGVE